MGLLKDLKRRAANAALRRVLDQLDREARSMETLATTYPPGNPRQRGYDAGRRGAIKRFRQIVMEQMK